MKRANGQGSIRYNRERKRYEMRITLDGVRRKVTGRTQAEAVERAEALRRSHDAGPGLPAEITVSRFLHHWITEVLPLADISPLTAEGYERIVKLYVIPSIGRGRLDHLAPSHVRSMLARMRDQGLSTNTQRQARSVLRRALRTAVADGLVPNNAAALADGVRVTKTKAGRTLTPDQARILLAAVADRPHDALVNVLLALGLRKGEALALSWRDIDLDATPATLTINRSLKKNSNGGVYASEPKTAGSRRTLHLAPPLVDVLRRHRARQHTERLRFGADWGGDWAELDLVFTSSIGTPLDPDRVNRLIKQVTAAAGLGSWTPHELRHSAASLLLAQNVPLKTVSEMLGHSSIRVTADVYGHLLAPARTEASEAMSALLWG